MAPRYHLNISKHCFFCCFTCYFYRASAYGKIMLRRRVLRQIASSWRSENEIGDDVSQNGLKFACCMEFSLFDLLDSKCICTYVAQFLSWWQSWFNMLKQDWMNWHSSLVKLRQLWSFMIMYDHLWSSSMIIYDHLCSFMIIHDPNMS